jgi:hypothetical protein
MGIKITGQYESVLRLVLEMREEGHRYEVMGNG